MRFINDKLEYKTYNLTLKKMADSVIFPDEITNWTPASDDRILFSDTSAWWETKDAEISQLPMPDSVITALNLKENLSNKSTNTNLWNSNTLYPTQWAVKSYVDAQVATATIPDATNSVKGKIKLAWDLAGTADLPTVPALWNKTDKTTTVNWKALSSNITLNTDDIWEWANNKYDKTVILTPWNDINITWTYPNFTINSTAKWHIIQSNWVDENDRWKLNFKDGFILTDNPSNNSTDVDLGFTQIPEYSTSNITENRTLDWNDATLNDVINTLWTLADDIENAAIVAWFGMQKSTYDPNNKNKEVAFNDEVVHISWNETIWWIKTFSSFPITPSLSPATDYEIANKKYIDDLLSWKVDKITWKWLSTEDYTTTEKNKLSWIAIWAQVNTVISVAWKTGAVTLVKWDVGLWNVDNTSDVNKPVSTATQTALNWKANLSWWNTFSWNQTFSSAIIGSINGNSNTATTLQTARTIQTNLASTSSASFNGSANITPWVTGTLPIWNGWTWRTDWRIANVLNHRDSWALSFWTWTQAQYNAIWTKDSTRIYIITDA